MNKRHIRDGYRRIVDDGDRSIQFKLSVADGNHYEIEVREIGELDGIGRMSRSEQIDTSIEHLIQGLSTIRSDGQRGSSGPHFAHKSEPNSGNGTHRERRIAES